MECGGTITVPSGVTCGGSTLSSAPTPPRLQQGVVSAARIYELDRFGPCTPNRVQRLREPLFLDSLTNHIFGFPFTPAPFMTSLSRGEAAKFSARLRVRKSW